MDADLTRETFGGRAARGVIPRAPDPPILAGPESEVAGDLPWPEGEVTG